MPLWTGRKFHQIISGIFCLPALQKGNLFMWEGSKWPQAQTSNKLMFIFFLLNSPSKWSVGSPKPILNFSPRPRILVIYVTENSIRSFRETVVVFGQDMWCLCQFSNFWESVSSDWTLFKVLDIPFHQISKFLENFGILFFVDSEPLIY